MSHYLQISENVRAVGAMVYLLLYIKSVF